MTGVEEIREQQRRSWEAFAPGWGRWDHVVLPMLAPVGEEMIRLLAPGEAGDHLDVAAGTGEPGLTIATRFPGVRVVVTDLAEGMLEVARHNAAARGIANVEIRAASADDLPFGDASFDTVSCRFGVMFVPDVAGSVREMARVLRPGGRLCVSVWAEPDGNPWVTIPMAAIGAEIELPAPPPGAPGIFRCAAPGAVQSIFEAAGLAEVREVDVQGELVVDSAEEYWVYMTDVAAPIVASLSELGDAGRRRVDERVIEQVRAYEVDGCPRLPLHARCIVGTG